MGVYITKADIIEQLPEAELIQLTDDEGTGANVDARVNAAIEDAEGEVDGYLSTRYTTPLSPAPKIIKKLSADIAIYNLYARRQGATEDRLRRYQNAIKFLENVSKGVVMLGADAPAPADEGTVSVRGAERVFTRERLEGF